MILPLALLLTSAAWAQPVTGWGRQHNTLQLKQDAGGLDIEFISGSTFRVRRGLAAPPSASAPDPVELQISQDKESITITGTEVMVRVSRLSGLVTAMLPGAVRLFHESRAQLQAGRAELVLETPAPEKFLGLGPRPHEAADARGLVLTPPSPFFIAGHSGYAFWMSGSGPYQFDVGKTQPAQVRITASGLERLEYTVAFGPSVKEIWDERLKAVGAPPTPLLAQLELIAGSQLPPAASRMPQTDLCGDARALVHASLSGLPMPAFDLGHYRDASDYIYKRAAGLAAYAPIFYDSNPPGAGVKLDMEKEAAAKRHQFSLFLLTYADEVRGRGYPVLHPLIHQFPRDPAVAQQIDAFMFGDELLIVPACAPGKKSVYLPQGIWTDTRTEQEYRGRQTATFDSPDDGVIALAKNGSIMPLVVNNVTELHYYPKLGGEFFFYEPEAADYSQVHAGPAADIYRVQIETKVSRKYEWVIHHMDRPKAVEQVDAGPVRWRYDEAARTVRIPVDAPAHSDIIHNIVF